MKRINLKRAVAALLCALLLLSCVSAAAFAAGKKDLAKCSITVASPVAYTGSARKAAVTVKDGKTTLKNGTDYTLAYANNKKIGTAAVTVTAKKGGAYTGAKTLKFKIVPDKTKALAAANQSGAWTSEQLDPIRELYRKAQWFFDFCYVENAEGAHNSELATRCLNTAEELINQGMALLNVE